MEIYQIHGKLVNCVQTLVQIFGKHSGFKVHFCNLLQTRDSMRFQEPEETETSRWAQAILFKQTHCDKLLSILISLMNFDTM